MKDRRRSRWHSRRPKPPVGSAQRPVRAAVPSRRRGWFLGVGIVLAVALAVAGLVLRARTPPAPAPGGDSFPVPPVSSSPFLNTRADAHYVGSAACQSCHAAEVASFRRTGMGRSMAEVDPAREPPDATVDHQSSRCRYQVVRKD